jgi:hypothetical protein
MNCPVCLATATNATPPTYAGLVVECARCGFYRVTRDALGALPSVKIEERLAALKTAKGLVSARIAPTISTGCLKPRILDLERRLDEPTRTPLKTWTRTDREAGALRDQSKRR